MRRSVPHTVRLALMLAGSACALGVLGCHPASAPAAHAEGKIFRLRGKVTAVDAVGGHITVAHGDIPGFMEAMTMSYKLADTSVAGELHPGDLITARVLVDYDAAGPKNPRLDEIVVVGQARPDTVPRVQYHVPAPGDLVPDFHLLNQSGQRIGLAQFRGRALLLTFIFTRCRLADFCPRMSSNFAAIDEALKADPAAYRATHLLSVSFDPAYDTPAVLRSYGGAHTGRFTQEDFKHWSFAAPSLAELQPMEQWFDVGVTDPGDPSTLAHSLSTVLIGKDGRVVAWYPTNDWQPAEVAARLKAAAAYSGSTA